MVQGEKSQRAYVEKEEASTSTTPPPHYRRGLEPQPSSTYLLIASSEQSGLAKGNIFHWQEGERCPYGAGMCMCIHVWVSEQSEY